MEKSVQGLVIRDWTALREGSEEFFGRGSLKGPFIRG
jgi:hypothetical protein